MIKKLLVLLLALFAAVAFAATEVNTASQADLDAVKGIGPAIATKIIEARKTGPFKDWGDLVTRVKGIGDKNSAKLSAAGLTVNGAALTAAPATAPTAARTPAKTPAAMTTAPATVPTAAPAAPPASATMSAADKKAAAKQEREDKKAAKKAAKAASAAAAASGPAKK